MSEHSIIGASSMHRWAHCPGSVRLSKGIESKSSAYADEGTRAHEIAASILTNGWLTRDQYDLSDEDYEAIRLYVQTIQADAGTNPISVEHKFNLSEIHPGLFGTADAVTYDPISKILRVADLKFGKGVLVEVQKNVQLMYYGLGALLSTGHPCSEVELVIVQPRAAHVDGPVRRWRTSVIDYVEFAADLRDFAAKTAEPNAPLVPGDHCRFCPANGVCPELGKKALAVAQNEFAPSLSYDPVKLSDTLSNLPILKAYIEAVNSFAYAEATAGRCPPGWKLVEKRATRQWVDIKKAESKAVILLGEDAYDKSLKSVAQIEKTLGKKEFAADFAGDIVSISSGLTLAEESDPRPAAAKIAAADEFKTIEN